MGYLDRLMQQPTTEGERVLGTVMTPRVLISDFPGKRYPTPDEHLQIVGTFIVHDEEVLVSRMGGLFVRTPAKLPEANSPFSLGDLMAKLTFQAAAAELFNVIQCELALRSSIITLPTVPLAINPGRLLDGHAAILGGGGAYERTLAPFTELRAGATHALNAATFSPGVLEAAAPFTWATTLAGVSATLPRFTLAAYSSVIHHEHPEALLMGWIVIEQLLDEMWADYVRSLSPKERRERLKDTRTYTAAVRAEVLLTAGLLEKPLYEKVQRARGHRNNLAHRALVTEHQANETIAAMHAMLEPRLGEKLSQLVFRATGVSW